MSEIKKYRNILERKEKVDYYQWEQNEKKEVETLCDHMLYNSIKECEIEIEKNMYIDGKENNDRIYGDLLSMIILYITVACSLFAAMIGQYASIISSIGDNTDELSTRIEFAKICEEMVRESYDFWIDIIFVVIIIVIMTIATLAIRQRKKRENDLWKLLYYKDRLKLLKEEEKKRVTEKNKKSLKRKK